MKARETAYHAGLVVDAAIANDMNQLAFESTHSRFPLMDVHIQIGME